MTPFRELYWNIPWHGAIYLLFLPFLACCLYGGFRLVRAVRGGQPHSWAPLTARQLSDVWAQVVLQLRLLRDPLAGAIHAAIAWGFGILVVATVLVALQDYLGLPVLRGPFYLYFMALTVDLFGVACTLGTAAALLRRYGLRPRRLWDPRGVESYAVFLGLLLAILLSGYLVEGLRIAATGDPWAAWSPGGWLASLPFAGLPAATQLLWHRLAWWGHAVLAFGFIALLPFTLIRHIVAAPLAISQRPPDGSRALDRMDLEEAEHFGVSALGGFRRTELLDLLACTECGRCQDACPAWAAGKPLTPKGLVADLRDHLLSDAAGRPDPRPLVGGVMNEEALWACTTCGACREACPVYIDTIPKTMGMRRFLVMEEARFPAPMQAALRGLESRGHPYQGAVPGRTAWAEGLGVP
ncbi:MAG: (Fe-S)-binding protein, partial [Candidatus Methylomirabilota bacterium]